MNEGIIDYNPNPYLLGNTQINLFDNFKIIRQPEARYELSNRQVDDLKHTATLAKFHFAQMCMFKRLPPYIIQLIGRRIMKITNIQTISICDNIENVSDVILVIANKKTVYSSFSQFQF